MHTFRSHSSQAYSHAPSASPASSSWSALASAFASSTLVMTLAATSCCWASSESMGWCRGWLQLSAGTRTSSQLSTRQWHWEGRLSSFQPLPYHVHGGPPSASRRSYSPYQRICTPASPEAQSMLGTSICTRRWPRCACPHAHMTFCQSESRICGQGTSNWQSNMRACDYFCTFSRAYCTSNTKLGRKTSSENRGVLYQNNRKGLLKTTEHSLRVLDWVMNDLTINSLTAVVTTKKVLEKCPAHNRG